MSKVRLYGNTSGYVDLQAPDVAGDVTITLPNATGPFALESYVDAAVAAIPAIAGIGSNVVQAVKTDTFTTTSTSYVDVTDLEVTITPSSNTSKILLIAACNLSNTNRLQSTGICFYRGSTQLTDYLAATAGSRIRTASAGSGNSGGDSFGHGAGILFTAPTLSYVDSPATTSATTYYVRMAVGGGTGTLNRYGTDTDSAGVARGASSIIAIEVAA